MQRQNIDPMKSILNALQQQKYQQVINLTTEIIQPTVQILLIRAKAYLHMGKPLQTIKNCQMILQCGGSKLQTYKLMVAAYLQNQDYLESQKILKNVLEILPQTEYFLRIHQAIQRLRINNNFHKLTQQQQNNLCSLKAWLYKGGSNYDKLKVINFTPQYRGVVSTKHIHKNQAIVFVPYSHMITLQMAKKSKLSQSLIDAKVQLLSPKHTFLSIFILEQSRKPQSVWKLYLDLLPKDHSCFPINYTKQQLGELVGSNFLFQIRQKVLDLKRDYDVLLLVDNEFQKFSFKDFCCARMLIGSRIFGLVIDGVKTQALVPFADMLNHKVPKQTVWNYSQERRGFVIESLEDIMPGEQVFDSYGRKCNSRFLLNYGFVLPNNTQNQICFKVGFHKLDDLWEKKTQMMKDKCQIRVYKISINLQENNFYQFMGFLRFYSIKDLGTLQLLEVMEKLVRKYQALKKRTSHISLTVHHLSVLKFKLWFGEKQSKCVYNHLKVTLLPLLMTFSFSKLNSQITKTTSQL